MENCCASLSIIANKRCKSVLSINTTHPTFAQQFFIPHSWHFVYSSQSSCLFEIINKWWDFVGGWIWGDFRFQCTFGNLWREKENGEATVARLRVFDCKRNSIKIYLSWKLSRLGENKLNSPQSTTQKVSPNSFFLNSNLVHSFAKVYSN